MNPIGFRNCSTILTLAVGLLLLAACTAAESPTSFPQTVGAPIACISFEGVRYNFSEVQTVTPGQATKFPVNGLDVDVDDLQRLGTSEAGTPGCIGDITDVYRADIDSVAIYTFSPEETRVNPEDRQILEIPAEWIRWRATDR